MLSCPLVAGSVNELSYSRKSFRSTAKREFFWLIIARSFSE